ncbi:MAG: transcriptional regulator [Gammaproteobacteria bacterium]|jgi:transcriptional regulator with XRE-family HTH domain|nr:transcriptional regulator [Gammaproteobacteria bacterium]
MSTTSPTSPEFGHLLRHWRQHRRLSQLALSGRCGISQRHISFLETGRARPSRPTVLALADALDVPLRERNALLQRSGFAAAYGEGALDDQAMALFREALQLALDHHEPYPALVLDGRWNMIMANQGALRLFGEFVDIAEAMREIGAPAEYQMVRLCLHAEGLRRAIVNWEELVFSFLQRARRALLHNPNDESLPALIDEILDTPGAPGAWRAPDWTTPPAPTVNMVLESRGRRYSLFTMLAHFGAPRDVTIEELSVETFYPADAATRAWLWDLAAAAA